jgi:hypothetical protein
MVLGYDFRFKRKLVKIHFSTSQTMKSIGVRECIEAWTHRNWGAREEWNAQITYYIPSYLWRTFIIVLMIDV